MQRLSLPSFSMPAAPHRVVIIGFPPAVMLDITGALEVFVTANEIVENLKMPAPYELVVAGPQRGPLMTTSGIELNATASISDSSLTADTLLLAGGRGAREAVHDKELMKSVADLCKKSHRVGSICTGAFPLAATGLLNHRQATTHWAYFEEFAQLFPQVALDTDALFVTSGKLGTSAGVSAGIDFALSLIEKDLGRQIALKVAQILVVFLKRPGGQSQFSAQLTFEIGAKDPERFADLIEWMSKNLKLDLAVNNLAGRVSMSPRNFTRRFTEALGVAPAKYVQALRIDAARRLLSDGNISIAKVAQHCGFPTEDSLRAVFRKHVKVSPTAFRERFNSTKRSLSTP